MPTVPFGIIALAILGLYFAVRNQDQEQAEATALAEAESAEEPEERIEDLIGGDRIGIEIGYRLIPLVDKERGGTLWTASLRYANNWHAATAC